MLAMFKSERVCDQKTLHCFSVWKEFYKLFNALFRAASQHFARSESNQITLLCKGGGVKPFNLSNEHYYAHFYALIGDKMYEWHVSSNLPELNAKPPQFEKSLVQPLRPLVMVAALWHIRFQMYKSLAGWGCQWKFPLLSRLLINVILQLSGTACFLWENRNFTKFLHYNEIFK